MAGLLHRSRSRSKDRNDSAGSGLYMSNRQMGEYLGELRSHRIARPTGARPPPAPIAAAARKTTTVLAPLPEPAPPRGIPPSFIIDESIPAPLRIGGPHAHRRNGSNASLNSFAGRPLVQQPRTDGPRPDSAIEIDRSASPVPYLESGQRWMEKQEARSLRMALEDMDLMAEQQLHKAAQDEASELVWKHRNPNNNPNAPYPLPEKSVNYREHLRKGSHARSQSWSTLQDAAQGTRSSSTSRSASGGSVSGNDVQQDTTKRVETTNGAGDGGNSTQGPERSATYPQLTNEPGVSPVDSTDALFSQRGRRRLSNSRRKSSGPFINPNDQIYEEPEEVGELVSHPTAQPEVQPVPAQVPEKKHAESISPFKNRRNPFSRVQQAKDSLVRSQTEPIPQNPSYRPLTKRLFKTSTTTIVTPSSDVSGYVSNPSSASPTPPGSRGSLEENIKTKEGKEVRGDDIRAATSMRMRDRSPKLPQPTMVSDSPGRPIVSFQQAWKPKEKELEEVVSKAPESKTPQPGRFSLKSRKDDPLPAPPKEYGLPAADSRRSVPPATTTQEKPRPIPTISVSESSNAKPKTIPSITFSDPTSSRPKPPVKNERPVAIPTINFPDEPSSSRRNQSVPSISVNSVPSISVTVDPAPSTSNSTRPLPTISVSGAPPAVPSIVVDSGSSRPLPTPRRGPGFARPNAGASRHGGASHWTPSTFNTGALCSHCALPISGRTVSAAGARFHPECFGCFHCGEKLECVAFYPEPDNVRAERLDRIHRRQAGEMIEGFVTGGVLRGTEADDGDEGMRFYCHLDFHEFFSPRCKSCKTPIEGEVVVACGAEWHVGHFFCAQCGDPFDPETPFVEKDNYAWCINCHTNRYSAKCKKCRKPVTDMVIKALGAEWHEKCFCCTECSGPFEDGRYFLRAGDENPVCVQCEERRLKA